MLIRFWEKEKLNILVTSSELHFFLPFYLILGTEKLKFLLLWTVVGGRVGYQSSGMFCLVIVGVLQVYWAVWYLERPW